MKRKKTILVVDDDIDFSDLARIVLEQKGGFEVAVCNQGVKAVEVIRELRPDLILLDIMMPGMDGTEIAAQLRKDPQLCIIPIIFLTSLMTPSEAASHAVIANYRFIPKPIRSDDLLRRVKEFFEIEN